MKLTDYNKVFFMGIGGIGMSALARWFRNAGYTVGGYDRTTSGITQALEADGAQIIYADDVDSLPQDFATSNKVLVVYTPAIPTNSQLLSFFNQNGFSVVKRSVALGIIAQSTTAICISGTHGKTSVSTMVACILDQTEIGVNAFLGGISKNFNSNVVIRPESPLTVIEADEFDRSFLTLYPQVAVVTAIDADHLDIYGTKAEVEKAFSAFVSQVKEGGVVIMKKGLNRNLFTNTGVTYYTYSLNQQADFFASDIAIVNGEYHFNLHTPHGVIADVCLGTSSLYNVENAVAAAAAAMSAGATDEQIRHGILCYAGVRRRFDVKAKRADIIYIDDYAHHPEEIKACLRSVRDMFPTQQVTVIFQPHLYTRTRDFATEFAEALDLADRVIVTDIYPAREEPIDGVTPDLILSQLKNANHSYVTYSRLLAEVERIKSGVLLTMGAGNIDMLIDPIHQMLIER